MSSDLLFYRQSDGFSFSAPVLGEAQVGGSTHVGNWEKDWAQVVPFSFGGKPYVLLYRQTDGHAFSAPILSASQVGPATLVGNWEKDWSQITSFSAGGKPYLLLYRQTDGHSFSAPILSASQVGPSTPVGNWEKDWAQIKSFTFGGNPYLLFYRQTDGHAFSAPILSNSQVGTTSSLGIWEKDWAQILPFVVNGDPFLLLYRRTDGTAFSAPILSASSVGSSTAVGHWETDWTQILDFSPFTTTQTFDSGALTSDKPLGGSAHVVMQSNGDFTFSCHAHDSGFDNIDYVVSVVIMTSSGMAFTFQHSGHTEGTVAGLPFGTPKRDDDFTTGGNNIAISNEWSNLPDAKFAARIDGTDATAGGIASFLGDLLKQVAVELGKDGVEAVVALVAA